jgi:quinol monooxygenase YgiN
MPGIVTIESSCFIARFHVDPAKRSTFEAIFDALWRGAQDLMEAQCNLVYYGWDRDDRTFFTIESYKDETALAALRESEMFQTVVRQLLEQCDAPMELQLLRGMAAGGEVFDLYPAGPSKVHPAAGPINVVIS